MKIKHKEGINYCSRCAGVIKIINDGEVKRLACSKCQTIFYQNSKPTASAIIKQGNRILLVKRSIKPRLGYWDLPGGFLENGEEPVAGLRREIKEELGVSIKITRFLGIYMDVYKHQYLVHTMNILYEAQIKAGKLRPMSDVRSTKWFDPSKIPWSKLAFKWIKLALTDRLN